MIQIIIFFCIFQMLKSLTDCFICHRRNPQTLTRLMIVCFLQNPAGNQLPLSAGIGGNDDIRYILTVDLSFYCLILLPGLLDDLNIHFLRKHWQIFHLPVFVFFIVVLRICQRNQMAKSPCYDILTALQSSVNFLSTL